MTRKQFRMIAAIVATIADTQQRRVIAIRFAEELRKTNPLFNSAKFMEACNASSSSV